MGLPHLFQPLLQHTKVQYISLPDRKGIAPGKLQAALTVPYMAQSSGNQDQMEDAVGKILLRNEDTAGHIAFLHEFIVQSGHQLPDIFPAHGPAFFFMQHIPDKGQFLRPMVQLYLLHIKSTG